MDAHEALCRLADAAGIEARYWDIHGQLHETTPDTMRALLRSLGHQADSETEIAAELAGLTEEPWRAPLAPTIVAREGGGIDVPLRLNDGARTIRWSIRLESGETRTGEGALDSLPVLDRRGETPMMLRRLTLGALPAGYHELRLEDENVSRLIVAPPRCYLPPKFSHRRSWGVTAQLYALRADGDFGIGDFAHLRTLVEAVAARGGDVIGLNPLHALFLDTPQDASPYSPCSRLFRNPLYLELTAITDFAQCAEARALMDSPAIVAARKGAFVDYRAVAEFKLAVLEQLYRSFEANYAADGRSASFRHYTERAGEDLERFATFQMLSEHFGTHDWTAWPQPARDYRSPFVSALRHRHEGRVAFFKYLQWQCEEQFSAIGDLARRGGMSVGLYNDLAVSVDAPSADHWSHQELFAGGLRVGAPPDPFNETGQEWGVVPLNPSRLAADGYAHFSALLGANMRHAGALRIDHVMGWQRLFLIPAGAKPADGAYVRFPIDDLLAVAALESQRHRCLVVGEDLGTVPAGFRERMAAANVLSCRVFYFEREQRRFRRPDEYPQLASVSVSTHDLATLRGFWDGDDIRAKAALGLFKSTEDEASAVAARSGDKHALLEALAGETVLPEGFSPSDADRCAWTPSLARAVHLYLARSGSYLFTAQLDDLCGVAQQANLPGSTSEYPNWRRRQAHPLNYLLTDARIQEEMTAIASEREK